MGKQFDFKNFSKDELVKLNLRLLEGVIVFFSIFNFLANKIGSVIIMILMGLLAELVIRVFLRKANLILKATSISVFQFLLIFMVGFEGGRIAELYTFFVCSHVMAALYFERKPVLVQCAVMNVTVIITLIFFYNVGFPGLSFGDAVKGLIVCDFGVLLVMLVIKWGNDFIAQAKLEQDKALEFSKKSEESIAETKALLDEQEAFICQIYDSAMQITDISNEVSSLSSDLNSGVETQMSTMEILSNSIMDISMKVQDVNDAADISKNLSLSTGNVMKNGKIEMLEMLKAMSDLKEASTQISKVIKEIDNIAFQTNILALNAAVEAARAGAAGKGFAVVADEVSNLANKSAASAKSTASLMENIISSIGKGINLAQSAVNSFNEVVEAETKTLASMQEISISTSNQVDAVTGLATSCVAIESVVTRNKDLTQTCELLANQLECQATLLQNIVNIKNQ